jgi:hypothetical protein
VAQNQVEERGISVSGGDLLLADWAPAADFSYQSPLNQALMVPQKLI